MTRNEITEMAMQADIGVLTIYIEDMDAITLFAELVAAKEREACAQVARDISEKYAFGHYGNEVDTADEIAAAIRARNAKNESKSTSI